MGQVKHKMSYTQIYHKWSSMISRCRNEKDPNYINYGARGISVCEKWKKFQGFYEDMGEIPFENAQLDRIDNNGNYIKENCQWSSPKDNSRNRRTTKKYKTDSETFVQVELMEKIGWTKNQFRWFKKRYGISWILDNFKNDTLPVRTNHNIVRTDIEGKVFGKWIVIKFVSYTKKQGHLYLCKCECGIEREIPRNNLMREKTKSCIKCSWKLKRRATI